MPRIIEQHTDQDAANTDRPASGRIDTTPPDDAKPRAPDVTVVDGQARSHAEERGAQEQRLPKLVRGGGLVSTRLVIVIVNAVVIAANIRARHVVLVCLVLVCLVLVLISKLHVVTIPNTPVDHDSPNKDKEPEGAHNSVD
ncbi:MAG: hypothetical protein ACLP0J_26030 [Solirubrobacteraceae bacterium]